MLRTESTCQAVGWLVMLVGTVAAIAMLVRAARLLGRMKRQADSGVC
ncbi:hypothetical protein [Streptomyces sp. NPDC059788]